MRETPQSLDYLNVDNDYLKSKNIQNWTMRRDSSIILIWMEIEYNTKAPNEYQGQRESEGVFYSQQRSIYEMFKYIFQQEIKSRN